MDSGILAFMSTSRRYKKPQLVIGLCFVLQAFSIHAADEQTHTVNDLAYGVSLYHFFQNKHFSAITDLLVAKKNQTIQTDNKHPDLLLGGLYLSYGLNHKATDIFQTLLDEDSDADIRNEAWFNIGKTHYRYGFIDEAEQALSSVNQLSDSNKAGEQQFLLSTIYSQKQQYNDALTVLAQMDNNSIWHTYSQFNVGAGLINSDAMEMGTNLLTELAQMETNDAERLLLKDKANLALGYSYLQYNYNEQAIQFFEQVRLDDSESSKALLGLGWSRYKQAQFKQALSAWAELKIRSNTDLSSLESLTAIPHAFEKLGHKQQALNEYSYAIDRYSAQLQEVDNIIAQIRDGRFLKQIKISSLGQESITSFERFSHLDLKTNRYLLPLFTSTKFQDALNSHQDLSHLIYRLNQWQQGLPALNRILQEKRNAFKTRLAGTIQNPKLSQAESFIQKRHTLAAELKAIETKSAELKLADNTERKKLAELNRVSSQLKRLQDHTDLEQQADKFRLLYGLVFWDISTDYPVRLWQAKQELKELDASIAEMNRSLASLKGAQKNSPAVFNRFSQQIKGKDKTIENLKLKVTQTLKEQEANIEDMALNEAQQYRRRLKLYHDRAQYSKARLYDSLLTAESK